MINRVERICNAFALPVLGIDIVVAERIVVLLSLVGHFGRRTLNVSDNHGYALRLCFRRLGLRALNICD